MFISENYIGIKPGHGDAFKLFNRRGLFIGNVGGFGQGPGEYTSLYHAQICEKVGRIYLTTFNANRILAYNLRGEFLEGENIPLAFMTRKAVTHVDNENRQVVVLTLPFQGMDDYAVWVQDFEGNVMQKVGAGEFAVVPDFSNEVFSFRNTPNFDFRIGRFFKLNKTHCSTTILQIIPYDLFLHLKHREERGS